MDKQAISHIRRATAVDANLLAELGARTFSETFAEDNTPEDMAAYLSSSFSPALQTEELADANTVFLIAEIDGIAAGYAKMQRSAAPSHITSDKPIELSRLYVTKETIGRGVGAALMEACLSEARQAGCKTMWLGVWEHNERAQQFYKRWGFQVVGEHSFRLGADLQRDLLMQREIA